jgi:hypothetical protein
MNKKGIFEINFKFFYSGIFSPKITKYFNIIIFDFNKFFQQFFLSSNKNL